MFGWLRLRKTPVQPGELRVGARLTLHDNRLDDIDSRLEYLTTEIKKVRGRQFALERSAAGGDDEEQPARPQLAPLSDTTHLARRFRGE